MGDIKFSIVVPSFNSERYIASAMDSLLAQDYSNIELIVIDGGSSDETLTVLEKYRDLIDVLVSQPDDGQSDAFNKGFGQASGDFFLWLNSDDLLVPGFLKLAGDFLTTHRDCKWLTFNTVFIDADSKIDFCYRGPSWSSFCIKGKGPQVDCPTSIFHREIFLASEGFDLRLNFAMDIDLWHQFLKMGYRWHRLNQYGYAFRMHELSKTGSHGYGAAPSREKLVQSVLITKKHNIRTSSLAGMLVKLRKLLFAKPVAWLDTLRWRGKHFSEFRGRCNV